MLPEKIWQHWPTFRERAEQAGGLPKFVVDEFEAYLRCGILEHGLAHFACRRCGRSRAVAWSCKARGFCPSCIARRMSDCAAHLVDEVLPRVPVRQWVASLPWQLRYAMGYDAKLCSAVLAEFMRALRRSLQRRGKLALGLRSVEEAKFGALAFIQRADSSLRLNVHFHCLVLDGVYVRDAEGQLCFHALPRPTPEEVAEVARWTHEAIARVLARHGRTLDGFDDAVDELADEQPALASCYSASVSDRQLLGASPGEQTRKLVHPVRELSSPDEALAEVGGVNVHVGSAVDGRDRKRLERVCRYMTRPPVCLERLEVSSSGQVVYAFKRAWRSGAHAVVLDPLWRAYDRHTKRIVALKILHGQWANDHSRVERFRSGSRRMQSLRHEAVVRVLDDPQEGCGSHTAHVWSARAGCGCRSRRNLRAPTDAAHFGSLQTIAERRLGVISAAPEQHQDAANVDARADIYSLGMTVLFVLVGKDPPPFVSRIEPRYLSKVGCSSRLRSVLKLAVAYETRDRTTTCEELAEAIRTEPQLASPRPAQDRLSTSGLSAPDFNYHFARGVAFANMRHGADSDIMALESYSHAVMAMPESADPNLRARVLTYRGAILKRLARYEEA